MMLKRAFFEQLHALIEKVETTLNDEVDQAAQVISDAMAAGKGIHIYDTGHMLSSELIHRAGGMAAFHQLNFNLAIDNPVRKRDEDAAKDRNMEGLAAYVFKSSGVHPGDVLIIGSVSGKSVFPVDLAIIARSLGVYVIALTSVTYSSQLVSEHSSGKRLYECADLVIDNCAPSMDAMVEVPGMEQRICPASGISAATIMWAITAQVTENLLKENLQPSILKSINKEGSAAFNEKILKQYAETGL